MQQDLKNGIDPAAELNQAFHLAGLRMLADMKLKGEDQCEAIAVIRDFDKVRREEERLYHLEYHDRVNDAMKALIDEAGAKDRSFKPGFAGHDRFDQSSLQVRAERRVRHAHRAAMSLLDQQETRALEAIAVRADEAAFKKTHPSEGQGRREAGKIPLPVRPRSRD